MQVSAFSSIGYEGHEVRVECDILRGLPNFSIVGLPGTAVQESKQRVSSALHSIGADLPNRRVLINLSPGNLPKSGSSYDLAIAISVLIRSGQVSTGSWSGRRCLFIAELGLNGDLRSTSSDCAALLSSSVGDFDAIFLSAALEESVKRLPLELHPVVFCRNLSDVAAVLANGFARRKTGILANGGQAVDSDKAACSGGSTDGAFGEYLFRNLDPRLRDALVLAAAGMHNILLYGPPGSGKTSAARLLEQLVPPEDGPVRREQLRIHLRSPQYGSAGTEGCLQTYREPHHSATAEAVLGGGRTLNPGEISLAHGGILVIDEAPEFHRNVLQSLREPMEKAEIRLLRADNSTSYPCRSLYVFTMNLCPCGNRGRNDALCMCTERQIQKYWSQVGGALFDRMEIRWFMNNPSGENGEKPGRGSFLSGIDSGGLQEYRQKILGARRRQRERYAGGHICYNSYIDTHSIEPLIARTPAMEYLLKNLARRGLAGHRQQLNLFRLALTISDLQGDTADGVLPIREDFVLKAAGYLQPEYYSEFL